MLFSKIFYQARKDKVAPKTIRTRKDRKMGIFYSPMTLIGLIKSSASITEELKENSADWYFSKEGEIAYKNAKTPAQKTMYFFDYLNKEYIADILYRYIDHNVIMAENTAETLYNCGRDVAMQYPKMVLELQRRLGSMFQVMM